MEIKSVGILLLTAVAIIVGLVMLTGTGGIASLTAGADNKISVVNESIDISAARLADNAINETYYFYPEYAATNTGWRAAYDECDVLTLTVTDGEGNELADPTDYVYVYELGRLRFEDDSTALDATNDTLVSYSYCGDNYVGGSANQNILNIVLLMAAVAIIVVAIIPSLRSGVVDFIRN
jgi:hypothetical protein